MSELHLEIPRRYNVADAFVDRHLREGRGGKVAIRCGGKGLTYSAVAKLVNRAGNGLKALGVQEEQRVLLILPDGPEFAACYFGAMKVGAVAVPTNTALKGPDYAYFLDESRARVLVVGAGLYDEVAPVLESRPWLRHVVVTGQARGGALGFDAWTAQQPDTLEAAPTSKDDAAFWLWTSGSTGLPKAAVHRHQDWLWCCEGYAKPVLGISEGDVTFSTSKLFHAYGLGNGLLFPFHAGATTVHFAGKPMPRELLQVAHEEKPSLFFSVPTLYARMLHETDHDNPFDLSSVRLAVSAAEPLPAELFKRWKERFHHEILDGIGSTEVLHIYVSPRAGGVKPGSTGVPCPGYEVKLTGDGGAEVGAGQIGDLWVRGRSTALEYWNRLDLTRERMRGEWFFTGDKYVRDEDGDYWYAGRSDDMFRCSGQWVSPNEVEGALVEHPAVLECAVVPYEDADGLTKPRAFVILKDGHAPAPALAEELKTFVRARITPYKHPREIVFVRTLPKTAAGKIQRFKLRDGSWKDA